MKVIGDVPQRNQFRRVITLLTRSPHVNPKSRIPFVRLEVALESVGLKAVLRPDRKESLARVVRS